MYKNWLFIALFTFISINSFAQEDIIAKEYFKKGEFEKALTSYQKLYKEQPNNQLYLFQIVKIEQELERYKNAENRLVDAISKRENPNLLIELGYNFQLQNDTIQAQTNYNKALNYLKDRPTYAYSIGRSFESHSLLEQAITTYTTAMQLKPTLNFNMQLAKIYGEQGDISKMFNSYLDFAATNPTYLDYIKREISELLQKTVTAMPINY